MGSSSSTDTLSSCERLPDEILMQVLEHVMLWNGLKKWCGAVRRVSRRWRALHDAACQWLRLLDGVIDEIMHALCGRLPALTWLNLFNIKSLTADGLRAVGGLTTLTELDLSMCSNVSDAVLRELRGLTKLTDLNLCGCSHVTDAGCYTSPLTSLTEVNFSGTQAGKDALKATLPALTMITSSL